MKTRLWTTLLAVTTILPLAGPVSAQDSAIPLGTPMPGQNIELTRVDGAKTSLATEKGSVFTAILFWGNRCPWTARYEDRIKLLGNALSDREKVLLLINSNDPAAFPAESAQESAKYAREKGTPGRYLMDVKSELARAFGASRTPQAFVFDAAGTLVYSGAIDDSPGDPDNVSKEYLRDALVAAAAARSVPVPETKAFGCMIRPVK